MSKVHICCRAV